MIYHHQNNMTCDKINDNIVIVYFITRYDVADKIQATTS